MSEYLAQSGTTGDLSDHEQSRRFNAILNDINVAINSTLDPDEMMRRVVNRRARHWALMSQWLMCSRTTAG